MSNVILILTLLAVFGATTNGSRSFVRKDVAVSNDTNYFDYFVFTQHFPQTVCFQWKEKTAEHTCNLPNNEEWTIHGIWPSRYNGTGPQFCNSTNRFDISAVQPLINELNVKWIDVENGTKPHSFWKHEWEKHGTCASNIDSLNTEFKYFQKGLQLMDQYDMKHVLGKTNILPGNDYLLRDFSNGIQKVLGVKSYIACINNKKTRERYLFEIRLCFDKTFKLINCSGILSNCSHRKRITYPGTVPNNYRAFQV